MTIGDIEPKSFAYREEVNHPEYGPCLLEIWMTKSGVQYGGGCDLPCEVAYDLKTGRRLYQAWNDKYGNRYRPGNKPVEICEYDREEPCMRWVDSDGDTIFIAYATAERRDPQTGELLGYIYDEPPEPVYDGKYMQDSLRVPSVLDI